MRATKRGLIATVMLASLLGPVAPDVSHAKKDPVAQKERRQERTQERRKQRRAAISRDEAAAIARSKTGGRVLNVKRRGGSYRVRILLDGKRVRTVGVNARSGAVSK